MSEEKKNYFFETIERVCNWVTDIHLRITNYHNVCDSQKKEFDRAEELRGKNQGLEYTLISLQEDSAYLQRQKELKEEELISLQESQEYLKREHEKLIVARDEERIELQTDVTYAQRDVEKKTEEILGMKYDMENALETCWNVRTGWDVMEARAEENEDANKTLEDFKNCEIKPLKMKVKKLEKKVAGLRGFSVSNVISATLNIDQRAKEIPFVYYDFVNQHLCYTPKTLEIFDIARKEKLTLKQLLSQIEKKYRKKIFKSLKSGKGLKHYKVMTSGEYSNELILTTHPYFYDKEFVGVGIFLRDSRYSFHRKRMHGFDKEIEEIVENMSKAFSLVGKSIEKEVERKEKSI